MSEYDCILEQYRALWKILDATGPQQEDCIMTVAKEIVRLRNRVKELEDHLALRIEMTTN